MQGRATSSHRLALRPGNLGRIALVLAAATASAALLAPNGGQSATGPIRVRDDTELAAAVAALAERGGTIVLLPHDYRRELVISSHTTRTLRIVGSPGTRIGRIRLDGARNVSIGGLTIAPFGGDAVVDVRDSDHIDLHDLVVTAAGTRNSASVQIPDSNDVTIRNSELTHCGDESPSFANCVFLEDRATNVTIDRTWFHDCLGCDFVHGKVRSGLTITRSRFERALPCTLPGRRCGHQDLIELFLGDRVLVARNVFGLYELGGAQLYLTGEMDHVTVENNVFYATDPRVPGYRARVGMIVGSAGRNDWCHSTLRLKMCIPRHVRVLNNTILSGARRVDGYIGSIRMSRRYGAIPRAERPILANNVVAVLEDRGHVCGEVTASVSNVVLRGHRCSRSDRVGAAHLDAEGRPTEDSALLIGRASRRFAPPDDFTGLRRDSAPDIGAFELGR